MYWVEMHVVAPTMNGFQFSGDYPQSRGAPMWVDYRDFGGFQPGFDIFGDYYDVNFVLKGAPIPVPFSAALLLLVFVCGRRARSLSP